MRKRWKAAGLLLTAAAVVLLGAVVVKERKAAEKKESVTLDWYVNFSWYKGTWGENMVSKKITDDTGVSIRFLSPSGNESEKVDALIGADALPDLITLGSWEPQVKEMIDRGMVYAYNDLADKYAPDFWENVDQEVLNWYTQSDGKLYSFPNSFYTPQDLEQYDNIASNESFLVRKDIYEAIGSPDMSTQEGFEAAVKKAAEMYPEVNGKPLIPIGAHVFDNMGCVSFDKHLQNFLAVPYEKDGQVYDRYTDPEYVSWLKLFRRLGEEGYLAPDIFVDTRTQMDEKVREGRYFCMLYQHTDIQVEQRKIMAEDPDRIYIAVDGPKNSRGDDPRLPVTGMNGWTVTLISKNCKDPERAIQLVSYMLSDKGQKTMYLGIEGETYDIVDGKETVRKDVQELLDRDRTKYDQVYGADWCYWMFQDFSTNLRWQQKQPECIAQPQRWSYPYAIYDEQYNYGLRQDSEEAREQTEIMNLWSRTLPELLLAEDETEFDEIFRSFIQKRDDLGFAQVQKKETEYMQNAKEKLQID